MNTESSGNPSPEAQYELKPVRANSEAWHCYHEIARTSLFKNDKAEYYSALKSLDSYYAHMTPLLLSFNGQAIATAAIDELGDGRAALRMIAVETEHQGRGHGRVLGSLLAEFAKNHGVRQLCVNADPNAVGYYASLGFKTEVWSQSENQIVSQSNSAAVQMVRDIR